MASDGPQSAAGVGWACWGAWGALPRLAALRWPPTPLPYKRLQHLRGAVELVVVHPGKGSVDVY